MAIHQNHLSSASQFAQIIIQSTRLPAHFTLSNL
ncbi:hypothetical protein TSAR_007999 [Trichomalopsis sarcophagae]|uniref:Uncharacterized protein n=1 Tax=Trichomalopsis sarcophagae TaxID=543379 RepID=A0A232FNI9_9HYME|nr:hypothetical protein TSAR_007999 [Trichomalopsis sarcophagae]